MNLNKLVALIKIIRPTNIVITILSIAIAAIVCLHSHFNLINIIFASISGGLTAAAGNIINDIFDFEIDKINRPDRPLPSKLLSIRSAYTYYIALNILSIGISSFINNYALIINLTAVIILFFYSYKLKRIVLIGNILVAFLTGLAFIYGGISVNNIREAIIPSLFALLINFIRELVKDMEDIEGDSKAGIISFPNRFGFMNSKRIIAGFSILLIAATFYPFLFRIYNIKYFLIILLLVDPILLFILKSLFKDDSRKNLNKISFILKLNMVFGLTAIYFGK
ncbi:MAG: geranylgeranylglycerol-phosphate geranylgeranyltransferase [Bacteroidetes bacterium]|nr:geranylgeranylglycerol-phosphate geranylgeranyltransferase [Bacteroidota bacterium]